jgi:preprotein translocase subunit SecG
MKKMKGGLVFILSLLLIAPLVLGATISNVQVSSTSITPNSALININANISDPNGISNVILYYRLAGNSQVLTESIGNGHTSIYYPNPQNGIIFDYRIEVIPRLADTIYYPTPTTWASFNSNGAVQTPIITPTQPVNMTTTTNNTPLTNIVENTSLIPNQTQEITSINNVNNTPITNTTVQTSNQTQVTGTNITNVTTPITGGAVGTPSFFTSATGIETIIFVVIVLLVIIISSARAKSRRMKIQEQTQQIIPKEK